MAPVLEIGNIKEKGNGAPSTWILYDSSHGYSLKSEGNKRVPQESGVHRKLLFWEMVPKLRFPNLAEFP